MAGKPAGSVANEPDSDTGGPLTTLDSSTRLDNHEWYAVEGAMTDLGGWLRSLGLGKYEAAFRENEIDETVLRSLTDEHLKQLGVTALGHRLKLLDAIAALRGDESQHSLSAIAAAARPSAATITAA